MQPFFSIGNFQLTLSLLKSSYPAPLYKSSINESGQSAFSFDFSCENKTLR